MKPQTHAAISFTLSLFVYYFFRSAAAAVCFFLAGVFIDVDHFPDYWLYEKEKPRLSEFFTIRFLRKHWDNPYLLDRMYVVCHSYEFALLAGAVCVYLFGFFIGVSIFLGLLTHIIVDNLENRIHPLTYFFFFRMARRFETERLYTDESFYCRLVTAMRKNGRDISS
jgi:hypothetical protein